MNTETLLGKYAPTTLPDVQGHKTIRNIFMKMVEQGNIPHMMFTGTPGNGKSTTARALVRDLYGDEYKSNYIVFDSSTERGIDIVRNRIKEVTKYKPINHDFKIIILEESDEMTSQAQFALREIMLKNQKICRFIFICNNLNKIIEPLQDRCQIFRFGQLQMDDIFNHITLIVKEENIQIKKSQISTISALADGSMRAGVNALQTIATQDSITDDLIRTVMGAKFDQKNSERILKAVFAGDQNKWESEIFRLVYSEGFTPEEIMHGILDQMISKNNPKDIKMITMLAEYDYRMSQGVQPLLQLRCGLARLASTKR